jgi:hypothetical protein
MTSSIPVLPQIHLYLPQNNSQTIINSSFNSTLFLKKKQNYNILSNNNLPLIRSSTLASITLTESTKTPDDEYSLNSTSTRTINSSVNNKWKKVKNVIKIVSAFNNHKVTPIINENQIDYEIQQYKTKPLLSQIKHCHNKANKKAYEKKMKQIFIKAITNDELNSSPKTREQLKEDMWFHIKNSTNHNETFKIVNDLFTYNPDRNIYNPNDKQFIYSSTLKSNGKTLLYLIIKEGYLDFVSLFLDKGINPHVLSIINENEKESNLQLACRMGYTKIVKVLLERVNYEINEIMNALKIKGLSQGMIVLLKSKLISLNKKKKVVCC